MLIPLKEYINNWLDTYTIKDIFTGKRQKARDIFNWDKSYFLKLLIKDKYYIDTDIDFATKDKNYTKIIKKPLSKITPKKIKKYRKVGEEKILDHYIIETIEDYVPITKTKYRLVDDYSNPKYETIIKRRKIGKKYYITTEYIETGKYHKKREYYEDVIGYDTITKEKKRPIYKTIDILEPYYEQERQRTIDDIQIQSTEYRVFEPFFVWEFYKTFDDGYEHYIYVSPLFQGLGNAVVFSADDDEVVNGERKGIFIKPKDFIKQNSFKTMTRKARFLILNGKKNLEPKLFQDARVKIDNNEGLHTLYLDGTYNQSLDVLKLLFFRPAPYSESRTVVI